MREVDGVKWYDTAEVGEMFGVTRYRISHHWLPVGRFPNAVVEQRQWWIPEADIRACADSLPVKKPRTRRPRKDNNAGLRRLRGR